MTGLKIPQILFTGNGLNLAYGGVSWKNLLRDISTRHDLDHIELKSPMPLQAVLVTENHVKDALLAYKGNLYGEVSTSEQAGILQRFLSMEFDHILTTNFSYELEIAAQNSKTISNYQLKKMMRHTSSTKQAEAKYLRHTFNECEFNGHTNKIWHVHGEARKPGSIIMGHYYYANLLCRVKKYLDEKGNTYLTTQLEGKQPNINSWMDAFILGDVYMLGFGYDLSEFDLWWMLDRKSREKAQTGKIYFFRPSLPGFDEKLELMKVFKIVEVIDCGVELPHEPSSLASEQEWREYRKKLNSAYRRFYPLAMEEICKLKKQKEAELIPI